MRGNFRSEPEVAALGMYYCTTDSSMVNSSDQHFGIVDCEALCCNIAVLSNHGFLVTKLLIIISNFYERLLFI